MIRFFDIFFSLLGLTFGSPLLLGLMLVGFFDTGSPIFCQQRVGRYKRPFTLLKFRTMKRDTESVATHLADRTSVTRYGRFLRRTKLDELPQLWNVLIGDMSLVGPRPGLFNQAVLTEYRDRLGIYDVRPGITGLAQVNQVDMSTPERLAEWDSRMIKELSLKEYFRYLLLTVIGRGAGDCVR